MEVVYGPSPQDGEVGELIGMEKLHSKFKATLDYSVRLFFKKLINNKNYILRFLF